MKRFKDMWEDAAANSVGAGGVDMPADVQHDKKKKKKAVYDGRTKDGKKFVEKMLARRKVKEINASKQNAASVSMKEETLESAEVEEGKYQKYSDLLIKKAKLVAQGPIASKEVADINKQIAAEMKNLGVKEAVEAEAYYADKNKKTKETLKKHDKAMIKVARDSIKKYNDKKEANKPVSKMTPAEKAANDKKRKEYNDYQKSKR